VGDSYDKRAGRDDHYLYNTEVIRRRGPWRGIADIEFAPLEWVHWFNTIRLFGHLGYNIPPAEHEAHYYAASGQLTFRTQLTESLQHTQADSASGTKGLCVISHRCPSKSATYPSCHPSRSLRQAW